MKEGGRDRRRVRGVEAGMDKGGKEEVERAEMVEVPGMVAEMAEVVAVAGGLCLPA